MPDVPAAPNLFVITVLLPSDGHWYVDQDAIPHDGPPLGWSPLQTALLLTCLFCDKRVVDRRLFDERKQNDAR